MMAILILLVLLILLFGGYTFRKDIFAPWNITVSIWLFIILSFQVVDTILYPLNDFFLTNISLWISGFYFSSIFIFNITRSSPELKYTPSKKIVNLYFVLLLIFLPLYLYTTYENIQRGDGIVSLRNTAVSGSGYGALIYLWTLAKALFIICLVNNVFDSKYKFYTVIFINLLFAFSIMEKGYLLFILISLIYVNYLNKKISAFHIALSFSGFILFSVLLNIIRTVGFEGEIKDDSIFGFINLYMLSPCIAFQTLESSVSPDVFGSHTLSFFYKIFNSIGLYTGEISNKLNEFVYIPIPTNVYTVMQPFYEDFNEVGVLIFGSITGGIAGFLYKKKLNNTVYTCIYTYFVYILFMQFFQEELFSSLSVFIQIIIYCSLPMIVSKFRLK